MTTMQEEPASPNVHLSVSLPAPLRARIDAEAAERKCSRASVVLAALDRKYGAEVEQDRFRPTGASHRDRILDFAATVDDFSYADAAKATGLEYTSARRYILQLTEVGCLERLGGTEGLRQGPPVRVFRLAGDAHE